MDSVPCCTGAELVVLAKAASPTATPARNLPTAWRRGRELGHLNVWQCPVWQRPVWALSGSPGSALSGSALSGIPIGACFAYTLKIVFRDLIFFLVDDLGEGGIEAASGGGLETASGGGSRGSLVRGVSTLSRA